MGERSADGSLRQQLADARAEAARLAQEQAALRRVAALVAGEASRAEVFTAIAEEIGRLLGLEDVRLWRYEHGPSGVVAGRWGEREDVQPDRHPRSRG